jgi:putative endonuclease
MNTVYILYSSKLGKFYIGQTTDLANRLLQHNDLNSSYSTKRGQPWKIFLTMQCKSISHAMKLERHIKNMKSKKFILNLKKYPELIERIIQQHIDC